LKVARLWRYRVKSLRGERCDRLELGPHGAAGDREYAFQAADGTPASAKHFPELFNLAVENERVVFPDGKRLAFDDPGVNAALGKGFSLVKAGRPFHDAEPLHLVTTASLAWAQADERRFRPNIVVEAPGEGNLERAWIGRRLRVGGALLEVIRPTGRCVMVTLPQAELPKDARLLRALAATDPSEGDALFGVYAEVVSPGAVRAGDTVSFEAT
jgi:uncharacterized protein YcbX